MKIVLATNNRHKVEELTHLLAGEGREIRTLAESGFSGEIVEDGATFEENSYIKARTVSERHRRRRRFGSGGRLPRRRARRAFGTLRGRTRLRCGKPR